MKELKPTGLDKLFIILVSLGAVLGLTGVFADITFLTAAGAVALLLGIAVRLLLVKCPYCGKYLDRSCGDYCPHCGSSIHR